MAHELDEGEITVVPAGLGQIGRQEAVSVLQSAEVPPDVEFSSTTWPIGGAMLQFPSTTPTRLSVLEAGQDYWASQLSRIKAEGFDWVELPSAWLPIADMTHTERARLVEVIQSVGLQVCSTSVVRKSVVDPTNARDNLLETHRAIDATAEIGADLICLGLHEPLRHEQRAVPWFWTVPGRTNAVDGELRWSAVNAYRELAEHASNVGVAISLELYEGTYLGNCDSAVEFIMDIDHDNVRLNPDLGNLIRAQVPIEPWESMAAKVLPLSNYWHVKNYARAEDPERGVFLTTPTPLVSGLIDYRMAIAFAIANGFRGPFLCENYGGDGLAVSADNALYLRRVLRDVLGENTLADRK